jgi:hypothetical protein
MEDQVRSIAPFPTPLHAILKGEPVRILAIGDQAGKSPVYLYNDANGKSTWESVSDFTVIDLNALPITLDALNTAMNAARQSRSGSSRT